MHKLTRLNIQFDGNRVILEIENIPPKTVPTSVKVKIKETIGINIKFIITEIKEVLPKAYKHIGIENICADKTAPIEDANFLGKKLNNFEMGFDKVIIPITTAKDS